MITPEWKKKTVIYVLRLLSVQQPAQLTLEDPVMSGAHIVIRRLFKHILIIA